MDRTGQDEFIDRISSSFIAYQRKEQNWCPNEFLETVYMGNGDDLEELGLELNAVFKAAMRFTLRCLVNPDCEGSREVLQMIEELRHGRQG